MGGKWEGNGREMSQKPREDGLNRKKVDEIPCN